MKYAIGTYTSMGGPGIVLVETDGKQLRRLCAAAGEAQDPIWIEQHPTDRGLLYAACSQEKSESGLIASCRWDDRGVRLQSIQPTNGLACCHLVVSERADCLYTANYVDGLVTVHPLNEDGSIQPACQQLQLEGKGPNPERQERAHAHQLTFRPESDQVFVCDLGSDAVMIYRRDAEGRLSLMHKLSCPAGIGPRHLAFDGPDRFYLVGELGGWIAFYQYEANAWQLRQLLTTVPTEQQRGNTAAAIRMEGSRVYVSNRGCDSIAVFDKAADGMLTHGPLLPTPGQFPRDFVLIDGGMLIACQNSGELLLTDRSCRLIDRLPVPGAVSILPLR